MTQVLEESKYTELSIDCCSWIQDTEINACLEASEHATLNFSKIGSLLTLIVSRENEDTKDHKFLSKSLLIIERKAGGKRENFHFRVNHHFIYFLVPSTTPLSTANTSSQQQSYLTRLTPPATLQLPKERCPFAAVCWGPQSQRLSITWARLENTIKTRV